MSNMKVMTSRVVDAKIDIGDGHLQEGAVARHAPDEVTDAINRALDEIGDQKDEFAAVAERRVLRQHASCQDL